MTNLVEMSGRHKLAGQLDNINILKLDNVSAGLLALKMFAKVYPNATMGDLYTLALNPRESIKKIAAAKMSGVSMGKLSWNPLTWIPATIEGTGDMLKSGGGMFSDAWHMIWDSPIAYIFQSTRPVSAFKISFFNLVLSTGAAGELPDCIKANQPKPLI